VGALVGAVSSRRSKREAVLPRCQRDFALLARLHRADRRAMLCRRPATIAPAAMSLGVLETIGPQMGGLGNSDTF